MDLEVDFAPAPDIDPKEFIASAPPPPTGSNNGTFEIPREATTLPEAPQASDPPLDFPAWEDELPGVDGTDGDEEISPGVVALVADLEGMGFNSYDAMQAVQRNGLTGAPGDLQQAIEIMLRE